MENPDANIHEQLERELSEGKESRIQDVMREMAFVPAGSNDEGDLLFSGNDSMGERMQVIIRREAMGLVFESRGMVAEVEEIKRDVIHNVVRYLQS